MYKKYIMLIFLDMVSLISYQISYSIFNVSILMEWNIILNVGFYGDLVVALEWTQDEH